MPKRERHTLLSSSIHLLTRFPPFVQLIFSVLKTLQDQELTVELKNDMAIRGQLKSVDQCAYPALSSSISADPLPSTGSSTSSSTTSAYWTKSATRIWCARLFLFLLYKATDLFHRVQVAVRNCFIRGSTVRYVQLPKAAVDTQLLEDATRRGTFPLFLLFFDRH